eukprot:sb/3474774/
MRNASLSLSLYFSHFLSYCVKQKSPHKLFNWATHISALFLPATDGKQLIRTRYLSHVTGYQPIRDQYFLIQSVSWSLLSGLIHSNILYDHIRTSISLLEVFIGLCEDTVEGDTVHEDLGTINVVFLCVLEHKF